MQIIVQQAAFDAGQILADFSAGLGGDAGAVVSFSGLVRGDRDTFQALEIEHYPAMTQAALARIGADAQARFDLVDLLILHRFGRMTLGEGIMMVATASGHRKSAFEGAEYLMDYLKSRAPFWKKEFTKTGENWVSARDVDEAALNRWQGRD